MTHSELTVTLNTMSQWLNRGQLDSLAGLFEYPLPLYMVDHFVLLRWPDQMREAWKLYREAAHQAGVVTFRPTIERIEDNSNSRTLFLMRWDHLRADGTRQSFSQVRYIFRSGDCAGRARIELAEHLNAPFKNICRALCKNIGAYKVPQPAGCA